MENAKSGGFDLGEFRKAGAETSELEITHPKTGIGTGVFITLLGVDSKEWRRESLKLRNENLKLQRKRNGVDAEKYDDDGIRLLAACTVGWRGLTEDGQPVPFTPENVMRIYRDFGFIRQQVDEFVSDIGNFIGS